jgi:hypothetical protein
MQAEFHRLCKIRDEIQARAAPKRAARDVIVNKAREEELKLNAEIAEIEKDLFDTLNQIGLAARACGGQTGEPPVEDNK